MKKRKDTKTIKPKPQQSKITIVPSKDDSFRKQSTRFKFKKPVVKTRYTGLPKKNVRNYETKQENKTSNFLSNPMVDKNDTNALKEKEAVCKNNLRKKDVTHDNGQLPVSHASKSKEVEALAVNQTLSLISKPNYKRSVFGTLINDEPISAESKLSFPQAKAKLSNSVISILEALADHRWYDISSASPDLSRTFSCTSEAVTTLKAEAQNLINALKVYVDKLQSGSTKEQSWLNMAISKGTATDKIAANVLLIQQCPLGRVDNINRLSAQAAKLNRREAFPACDALKDLFVNDLLPPTRKLFFFTDNPRFHAICCTNSKTSNSRTPPPMKKFKKYKEAGAPSHASSQNFSDTVTCRYSNADLVLLWFEDFVKSLFANFVLILANGSRDPLPFYRQKCLKSAFELMTSTPEQEKALLTILVMQLTNNGVKDSSSAAYFLSQLIIQHPPMTSVVCQVVVDSVLKRIASAALDVKMASTLLRPILFLSEIKYRRQDTELAFFMVESFLKIFQVLMQEFETSVTGRVYERQRTKYKKLKRKLAKEKGKMLSTSVITSKKTLMVAPKLGLTPDCRVLRAVLTGLNRAIPYIDRKELCRLTIDSEAFHKLIQSVESSTIKIAILCVLYRVIVLLHQDYEEFHKLLYNLLRHFSLYEASNRQSLLMLLNSIQTSDNQMILTSFALSRRSLQVSMHIQLPSLQLTALSQLVQLLVKHLSWSVSLLNTSDAMLLAEGSDEVFYDCPSDKEDTLNRKEPNNVDDKINGYNPCGSDPKKDNAELSHLWEIDLQRCSVIPTISDYANAVYYWGRTCDTKHQSVKPPELSHYIPKKLGKSTAESPTLSLDVVSGGSVLDLLAYRQMDDKQIAIKKEKNTNYSTLSTGINTSYYWDNKKHIYPHEKFIAHYFKDPFIRRQEKLSTSLSYKKDDDSDQECGEDDMLMESEENKMDSFLNNVLAKEFGDPDYMEEEEEEDYDLEDCLDVPINDMSEDDNEIDIGNFTEHELSDIENSSCSDTDSIKNNIKKDAAATPSTKKRFKQTGSVFDSLENYSQYMN